MGDYMVYIIWVNNIFIVTLNWEDVKIPLVVCMWVLFAGIAKIGFHYANRGESFIMSHYSES